MEFLFFAADDSRLFTRSDAESATWTVEEMSLHALFPFDPNKRITRGMRIGFKDAVGTFQPFEIRKVRTYEPDHYQEITAEHIAVAELSDDHLQKAEVTNKTAYQALSQIISGTLWDVGNVTSSGTSSCDLNTGSVWQGLRDIERNWNVYITPRVTCNASGITARYLDIAPATPVWNGVRLSLDKNADEMGVTWDDTNVITAIYGYGANVADSTGTDTEILTFASAVWSATASHPAKPSGQTYLEDPAAKAAYGRNGRNRFGYYQNSDIDDAYVLLGKSWEALQAASSPDVSIDCQVRDLYRLGYADQPLRLHDKALIEVRPAGEKLDREIVRLTVDLLDPTATRVTIGTYIPNIVYIQRNTQEAVSGGGGGGRHGTTKDASDSQDNRTYEFQTSIQANQYQIDLHAVRLTEDGSILEQAGLQLNAQGVLIYAESNPNMIGAKLKVQADQIALVVSGTGANAKVNAASIVIGINNQKGTFVKIRADKIDLEGYVTMSSLNATLADAGYIETDDLYVTNNFTIGPSCAVRILSHNVTWQSISVCTGISPTSELGTGYITSIGDTFTTIYYLGR